tara:strand:+ start:662 stop:1243 length:582 start_codon:yes stop_codon:yes gene_type:complete
MISHKHKFIFIEVPKTGTTTICYVLKKHFCGLQPSVYPDKHLPVDQYKKMFPKEMQTYFKFGFVRNPWSRVVSLFHRNEGVQMRKRMTFVEFVDWIQLATDTSVKCNKFPKKNMLGFFEINNKVNVDFIGKYENLQEDFNIICDKIGIQRQELPHINKSEHKHYTEYYDEETKKIVAKKFEKDIEYFGYKFGE